MTKLENLVKNLNKANQRLKEAVKESPTRMNKDATIKRFEFTFELSWKAVQTYVREQGLDYKSPKGCLREAGRLELIEELEKWFEFLDNRNLISHIYNQRTADKVYKKILKFPEEVDKLLKKLKEA